MHTSSAMSVYVKISRNYAGATVRNQGGIFIHLKSIHVQYFRLSTYIQICGTQLISASLVLEMYFKLITICETVLQLYTREQPVMAYLSAESFLFIRGSTIIPQVDGSITAASCNHFSLLSNSQCPNLQVNWEPS